MAGVFISENRHTVSTLLISLGKGRRWGICKLREAATTTYLKFMMLFAITDADNDEYEKANLRNW